MPQRLELVRPGGMASPGCERLSAAAPVRSRRRVGRDALTGASGARVARGGACLGQAGGELAMPVSETTRSRKSSKAAPLAAKRSDIR